MNNTTGPWRVERDGGAAYIVGDGGLVRVAEICEDRDVLPAGVAKANARLIAAAPAMFEALKRAQAALPDAWFATDFDVPRDVVELIETVIAKAEGRVE